MKVAHLTFSGKFGGRERVAFSLVELLRERVDAVLYVVVEDRASEDDRRSLKGALAEYGAPLRVFHTRRVFSRATLHQLAQAVEEDGVELIHSHCNKSIFYALLIRKLMGRKIANSYTLHGLILPPGPKSMAYSLLNVLSIYLSDGVVSCSRQNREKLAWLPGSGKIEVIQNSLGQPDRQLAGLNRQGVAKAHGIDGDRMIIGNISRISGEKNIPLYLRAIRHVKDHYQGRVPAAFLLVGDGELRGKMELLCRELEVEDLVVFTGFVSNMQEIYAAMDMVVLTSDREGTPMSLLEAMANGLPVVASRVGGVPDMIRDGVDGLLFERGDADGCARALLSLMADDALREKLGLSARQRVFDDFSPANWAARHIAHYERLLAK